MSIGSSVGGTFAPATSDPFAARPQETQTGFGDLSSEDFMSIILAELSNQDPTQPQDTQALLDQISTIRSIESDQGLVDQLDDLTDESSFATAANLIGAIVEGRTDAGQPVVDSVLSVSRTLSGTYLNLVGGDRLRMENVDVVLAPIFADPQPDTPPTDPPGDVPGDTPSDTPPIVDNPLDGLSPGGNPTRFAPVDPIVPLTQPPLPSPAPSPGFGRRDSAPTTFADAVRRMTP
ncbi:MAG: flagellar hook capping FlgD N-terminal domain-containing protein [Planctomycetota bacterium]